MTLFYLIAWGELGSAALLEKMEAAYDNVKDYQTQVVVTALKKEGSFETKKFVYTFKKPKWIRLDLESPHSGMILVYPDQNGKVVVQLPGVAHFIKLHLSPDDHFLEDPSTQRIDQTDMGLLIKNISHSLTDQRRSPAQVTEQDETLQIRVLADNHFRKGVVTLYRFFIDKKRWLPVKIEESTPDGHLERTVTFQNFRTNIDLPDSLFQLDG